DLLAEEADGDPEYRRWKDETLQAALSQLEERAEAVPTPVPEPRPRWQAASRYFALAASALLVVSVWSLREMQEVKDQLLVESRRSADLERTSGDLEKGLEASGRELRELREEYRSLEQTSARSVEEQEERVATLRGQLRAARSDAVHRNLPVGILKYDTRRNPVERRGELTLIEYVLELRRDTREVALGLEVVNAEPFDEYELRILDDATGTEVLKTGGLLRSGAVVTLSLPSSVFELRRYRLLLYGLMDGERTVLKEGYLLNVREAFGEW
ncbi:MAG: hypothetical protein GY856_04525, partial [bacterium]|nr:hypothetical protein [bacterium]